MVPFTILGAPVMGNEQAIIQKNKTILLCEGSLQGQSDDYSKIMTIVIQKKNEQDRKLDTIDPEPFSEITNCMRMYLCCLYIVTWHELHLSGLYNSLHDLQPRIPQIYIST